MANYRATISYEFQAPSEEEANEIAYQIAWAANAFFDDHEIDSVCLEDATKEEEGEGPTVCDKCQDEIDDEQYTIGEGLCEDCSAARHEEEEED